MCVTGVVLIQASDKQGNTIVSTNSWVRYSGEELEPTRVAVTESKSKFASLVEGPVAEITKNHLLKVGTVLTRLS